MKLMTETSKQDINFAVASRSNLLLVHNGDYRNSRTHDNNSSNTKAELETAILHLGQAGDKETGRNQTYTN